MERTIYREIPANRQVWTAAVLLAAFVAAAGLSVLYVEHHGHIVTGMNNQIVWGLPHVFAIFLIVAASGALNVASIASVFSNNAYKPMARFSSLTAMALLAGGLAVLVLDLGRPDRLLVAMTTYNFSSIFAWNVILYTGFMGIVAVYLALQMNRVNYKWTRAAGITAFFWRLALTTGTGSIFGWLVARPGYDAAIMAPLFIAMSFAFGLAVFMLCLILVFKLSDREIGDGILERKTRLLGIFVALVGYFTAVQHLTALYAAEHSGFETFILRDGGIFTTLFWLGQIGIGMILPLILIYGLPNWETKSRAVLVSVLIVIGGFCQLYVILIGGQAYPMEIFPGYTVVSSFGDGQVASYSPSIYELALGLGGVALTLLMIGAGSKVLRVLPTNLKDANIPEDD